MSYLLSSELSLFVRADKVDVGLAFRSCLTCKAPSLTPFLESSEISLNLLSSKVTRLSMAVSETNRMTKQEIMHTIAMNCAKEQKPSDINLRFRGFRSLVDSCSIWAEWIQTLGFGSVFSKRLWRDVNPTTLRCFNLFSWRVDFLLLISRAERPLYHGLYRNCFSWFQFRSFSVE